MHGRQSSPTLCTTLPCTATGRSLPSSEQEPEAARSTSAMRTNSAKCPWNSHWCVFVCVYVFSLQYVRVGVCMCAFIHVCVCQQCMSYTCHLCMYVQIHTVAEETFNKYKQEHDRRSGSKFFDSHLYGRRLQGLYLLVWVHSMG
jgi:hypothetical protein